MVEWLNILAYGEPGAGKTHFIGTADDHEDTRPVLLLDVEGGTTTLRKKSGIDVVEIRSIDQLVKVHNQLKQENAGYYKTVAIDSLTELQKLDMVTVMTEAYSKNPDRTDIDVPDQRAWGKSAERIRRIVRAYRDLPMNTIYTAHSAEKQDDFGGSSVYPSLPGKLRGEVPGFMDIVAYLYVKVEKEQTRRFMQFAKTNRVVAKDRTSALGAMQESPTVPLLWELIHAS
jgi:phage nucleotide-binding protein